MAKKTNSTTWKVSDKKPKKTTKRKKTTPLSK